MSALNLLADVCRRAMRSTGSTRPWLLRPSLVLERLEDRTLPSIFQGLPTPLGTSFSSAAGVSADGSTVVGTMYDDSGVSQAFRWTAADGFKGLGGSFSRGLAVSADGSTIVGDNVDAHAFRW